MLLFAGCHIHHAGRTADKSSKIRGGDFCIYINEAWCTEFVIAKRHTSPKVEFLMVKMQTLLPSSSAHIWHSSTTDIVITQGHKESQALIQAGGWWAVPQLQPPTSVQGIQVISDYGPLVLCWQLQTHFHHTGTSTPSRLYNYCPVGLTNIICASKCFEPLVLAHIKSCLPPSWTAFNLPTTSTSDAHVSTALHSVLSQLENNDTYVRRLFNDFSLAFNAVILTKIITKLSDQGIRASIFNWVLDFLTNRPQHVQLDHHWSSTPTLNTHVLQGCVMNPLPNSLFTHDCRAILDSISIFKHADDRTAIDLTKENHDAASIKEVNFFWLCGARTI